VDDETLEFLDWFEGVDQDLYSVFEIEVREQEKGKVLRVPTYMLDNFNPDLLNENTIYFKSYSSVNQFYEEYVKEEDSMEPYCTDKLKRQIKNYTKLYG
jgi:hypothetical protein